MTRCGQWAFAAFVALLTTVNRMAADALIPPHFRWWLTPVIALTSSLMTSIAWIYWGPIGVRKRTAR
jgi:hypothetical protein